MQTRNLVGYGEVLFFGGAVDDVGVLKALHDAVSGDDDDVELVNLVEFGGFRFGCSGHAGKLFVHAEVVLEGDGGEGLVFLADGDTLLGFDGLMKTIGPASTGHEAARKLVDDDDFALFYDVFDISLVEVVGLDRRLDVVLHIPVFRVGDVTDAEEAFDLFPALVRDGNGAGFFVDHIVAGVGLGLDGFGEFA